NSIPWLLLRAVSTEGSGIFQQVTYIQRVNTTGGVAPVNPGSATGTRIGVPYTAEYVFYREQGDITRQRLFMSSPRSTKAQSPLLRQPYALPAFSSTADEPNLHLDAQTATRHHSASSSFLISVSRAFASCFVSRGDLPPRVM